MKRINALTITLMVLFLLLPGEEAVITCGQVNYALAPCLPFLTSSGVGTPAPKCCAGLRTGKALIRTKLDSQAACNCFKAASQRFKNIKDSAAASLSKKCGVSLGIPISRFAADVTILQTAPPLNKYSI